MRRGLRIAYLCYRSEKLSLGYGATDTSGALIPAALQPNHLHEGASAERLQKSTEERCWRYLLRISPESRPR